MSAPIGPIRRTATLITGVSIGYQRESSSLFRKYQNIFLERYGPELRGSVIELGGERKNDHARFVPNASSYVCTNIARDHDEHVDITCLPFADGSQDAYLCVSVLEHVPDIQKALAEIQRTLKPGGAILLTMPFAYPVHDEVDYWRMSRSAFEEHFQNYDVRAFVHLGGLISTIVDVLQRPRGRWDRRYRVYKLPYCLAGPGLGASRADAFFAGLLPADSLPSCWRGSADGDGDTQPL